MKIERKIFLSFLILFSLSTIYYINVIGETDYDQTILLYGDDFHIWMVDSSKEKELTVNIEIISGGQLQFYIIDDAVYIQYIGGIPSNWEYYTTINTNFYDKILLGDDSVFYVLLYNDRSYSTQVRIRLRINVPSETSPPPIQPPDFILTDFNRTLIIIAAELSLFLIGVGIYLSGGIVKKLKKQLVSEFQTKMSRMGKKIGAQKRALGINPTDHSVLKSLEEVYSLVRTKTKLFLDYSIVAVVCIILTIILSERSLSLSSANAYIGVGILSVFIYIPIIVQRIRVSFQDMAIEDARFSYGWGLVFTIFGLFGLIVPYAAIDFIRKLPIYYSLKSELRGKTEILSLPSELKTIEKKDEEEHEELTQEEQKIFVICNNCGKEMNENDLICSFCGNILNNKVS